MGKSLYYNINQISEDDFLNLYVILESLEKPIQAKENYGLLETLNTDELNVSIKKFVNIGMINNSSAQFRMEIINSEEDISAVTFSLYPFAIELYYMIEKYQEI